MGLGVAYGVLDVRPAWGVQITACVEVEPQVCNESRRQISTRSDCDPQTALQRARNQSRLNAKDALAPICRDQVTQAEAAQICSDAGGLLPSSGTALSQSPVPRAGASPLSSQMHISSSGSSEPKLCAVLRDLPSETETSTTSNLLCPFNDGRQTTVVFSTRARCGVQCFDPVTHRLNVRRHENANLTNGDVDRILGDATRVLRQNNAVGDVPCGLTFTREGAVTRFTTGNGVINTRRQLARVFEVPGYVKVVNDIDFCGETIPNVIGCALRGIETMVVVRVDEDLEGNLWGHEFGHTQGLEHRENVNAIMNPFLVETALGVSTPECNAFKQGISASGGAAAAAGVGGGIASGQTGTSGDVTSDIRSFVRRLYIYGVPYQRARAYGTAQLPTLRAMLVDPGQAAYWSNIVTVMSIIGDESIASDLLKFVRTGGGKISPEHYRAKATAIVSLGYLINKTGSPTALNFLSKGLDPDAWPSLVGSNLASYQKSVDERDEHLTQKAILGLALSGHPRAKDLLQNLLNSPATPGQQKFRDANREVIEDALEEHEKVARLGLLKYYEKSQIH